jgi:two-component system, NtrC family, sensor histidine kinase HydH
MNRRILIQVTGPAVAIGVLLLATCLASAAYISRLQTNLANILSENVNSLEAAQELEIRVRQLRFHSFLQFFDPSPTHRKAIDQDQEHFEESLAVVRKWANTPEEQKCVLAIDEGYQRYKHDLTLLPAEAGRGANLGKLADAHPVAYVVEPCQELLRLNKEAMRSTALESSADSTRARIAMLLLGLAGPAGGVAIGYGVARGLSRSIYQLSVRVQNMAQRLDQDITSVNIAAEGDIQKLDHQLQHVVRRVEEVAQRVQQHQHDMLRAEQLSAVGQLGASVAHEVRNPLTSIKMLVDSALRTKNGKPLTQVDLHVIRDEIARMEQTVQGLLDFARLPAPQLSTFDLRDLIAHATELVRPRARQQGVEIAVRSGGCDFPLHADRNQLQTVLINLFLNALDAMPDGGRLEITMEQSAQNEARISVADTGRGIPEAMASRLFTPFASSKPTGTGLGLSISRRIIEEHGGRISVVNRPEEGACFVITLPLPAGADANGERLEIGTSSQSIQ